MSRGKKSFAFSCKRVALCSLKRVQFLEPSAMKCLAVGSWMCTGFAQSSVAGATSGFTVPHYFLPEESADCYGQLNQLSFPRADTIQTDSVMYHNVTPDKSLIVFDASQQPIDVSFVIC